MESGGSAELVTMTDIRKSFPGVKALTGVSFSVKKGEVHGLVGENGAGKSTLIKILMGAYQKDEGEIFIKGKKVEISNPILAKKLGLGAVYQDIMLAPHLSVAENFFMGKLPLAKWGTVNWKRIHSDTKEFLQKLNIDVDPGSRVKDLSSSQQEMVTIAKTMYEAAEIIIFDEPTALLSNEETEELFRVIRTLKERNVGIIYISHRLEEIFEICDTVTVLKDGCWINTLPVSETDEDSLISMMVGRDVSDMYSIRHNPADEIVLEVKGLTSYNKFQDINLTLHRGEIVGLFGLVGSGRTDIVRCIFGADRYDEGEVAIGGKRMKFRSPEDGIRTGLGLLPEDRKLQGLALQLSLKVNTNLAAYDEISRIGLINLRKERDRAEEYIRELRIKTPSVRQKVMNLSGGNQQKVVVSKWLCKHSKIFIFDEPTVGVDVGARVEIYRLFEKITSEGNSILVISSYLPEVMGLSDRIMVIWEGQHTGTVRRGEYDEEYLLRLASGITN